MARSYYYIDQHPPHPPHPPPPLPPPLPPILTYNTLNQQPHHVMQPPMVQISLRKLWSRPCPEILNELIDVATDATALWVIEGYLSSEDLSQHHS